MKGYFLLYNRISSFLMLWKVNFLQKYQALGWYSFLLAINVIGIMYFFQFLFDYKFINDSNFEIILGFLMIVLVFVNYRIFFKRKEYQLFIKEELPEYNIIKVNIGVIIYFILTVIIFGIVISNIYKK